MNDVFYNPNRGGYFRSCCCMLETHQFSFLIDLFTRLLPFLGMTSVELAQHNRNARTGCEVVVAIFSLNSELTYIWRRGHLARMRVDASSWCLNVGQEWRHGRKVDAPDPWSTCPPYTNNQWIRTKNSAPCSWKGHGLSAMCHRKKWLWERDREKTLENSWEWTFQWDRVSLSRTKIEKRFV